MATTAAASCVRCLAAATGGRVGVARSSLARPLRLQPARSMSLFGGLFGGKVKREVRRVAAAAAAAEVE